MKNDNCYLYMNNLSLVYDLYYDRTNTLKGYFGTLFKKNQYVEKKKDKLYALRNINIKIEHGERIGIIGLNGAGKSTFLKVASGLLKPTNGSLDIRGSVQPLIEIGAGFNPEFSGRENIYLNGAMLGFTKKQIKNKEAEIIHFSELENFIDVPVKYYSSGMSVRLAFTIATIINPEILLIDEMLSAGDLAFISKAKKRMDEIMKRARILIIVSHDLDLVESLTMRSIVINNGEIVFDGNTSHAIDYYREMVEQSISSQPENNAPGVQAGPAEIEAEVTDDGIAAAEDSAEEESTGDLAEEQQSININGIHCRSITNYPLILPEDDIEFLIEFETRIYFEEFYINVIIYDGADEQIVRLKNDYDNQLLTGIETSSYKVKVVMHKNSFKSGKYLFGVRLSGKNINEGMVVVESGKKEMVIEGEKKYSNFLNQEWFIEKR